MSNFTRILIPILLIVLLVLYFKKKSADVTVVKSQTDGHNYIVQNKPDKQEAAELLAAIKIKLSTLVDGLKHKYKDTNEGVTRLVSRFNPQKISEGSKDKRYTTYTLNKGEKIVFCLRARDNKENLHQLNLLAFVAIHELAHVMTLSTGHTEEFQKNFAFLLQEAVTLGIYQAENFRANPTTYCGIAVTDTPLPDSVFKK